MGGMINIMKKVIIENYHWYLTRDYIMNLGAGFWVTLYVTMCVIVLLWTLYPERSEGTPTQSQLKEILNSGNINHDKFSEYSKRDLTLTGFTLSSISLIIAVYNRDLSQVQDLLEYFFLGFFILFISSQLFIESQRVWHGILAQILGYIGVLAVFRGLSVFITRNISSQIVEWVSYGAVTIIIFFLGKLLVDYLNFFGSYLGDKNDS